jgi:hypothetical protein
MVDIINTMTNDNNKLSVDRRFARDLSFDPNARDTTDAAPALNPIARLAIVNVTGNVNDNAASGLVPSILTKYVSANDIDMTAIMPSTIGVDNFAISVTSAPSVRLLLLDIVKILVGTYVHVNRDIVHLLCREAYIKQ